jgi:hypothetical protein
VLGLLTAEKAGMLGPGQEVGVAVEIFMVQHFGLGIGVGKV